MYFQIKKEIWENIWKFFFKAFSKKKKVFSGPYIMAFVLTFRLRKSKKRCNIFFLITLVNAVLIFQKPLQSMAIVIGPCCRNFCSQQLKKRILATFGFNRIFCILFLKITLSVAELMLFGHLGAVISHRWIIICGVPLFTNNP